MKKQTQNKMRILSAVLALVMVLSTLVVLPMTANAETESFHEVWDGTTKTAPKGTGTEEDPYLIANGENLYWMAFNLPEQSSANLTYYKQTADIDLGGHKINSIGWQFYYDLKTEANSHGGAAFYGNYDGGNYTISNATVAYFNPSHSLTYNPGDTIKVTQMNPLGLFGAAHESTFKNIHLVNIDVGTYNKDGATINDVYSTNIAGGLVGAGRNLTIENCTVAADCNVYGGWMAGGLVGLVLANANISKCVNKGTVIANNDAGGLVGIGYGLTVSYCINDGFVYVDNRDAKGATNVRLHAGGIVASYNHNGGEVTETFSYCINGENAKIWTDSTAEIIAGTLQSYQGGILGRITDSDNKYVFSHCYNLAGTSAPVTSGQARDTTEASFKTVRKASDSTSVKQGVICGQVGSAGQGTMEYCQSVAVDQVILANDAINSEWCANVRDMATQARENFTVEGTLAGLVNSNGDAYSATYWTEEKISTNKYGESAANIKASADYLAIIEATTYTPGVTVPETNGVVYRGHQRSSALTDETYDIRLVATVDSLNYEEVGFKFSISGTGIEVPDEQFSCTKVYSSLTGKDDGITKTYTAEALGGTYLMALALEGFTADMGQITITVTPYWIEAGETDATFGTSYQVVYNAAGELVTQKKA